MEPLFIFMDLEAAHGNVYFGDIIELAAQVDPRIMDNVVFNKLVNTKQNLAYFVLEVCKISTGMLQGSKYFPEVFEDFMQWIDSAVKQCSLKEHKSFYPVLVAHGGFDMDFMMIQSNMERNEINLDVLIEKNVHFSDTYHFLKKSRLDGLIGYLNGSKLSIEALHKWLHPRDTFIGQHRALQDVKFMIKIFLNSPLKDIFDNISIATLKARNEVFYARHTSVAETELLSHHLPKNLAKVTHTMTLKRLLRNGVTYDQLQNLFKNSISFLDFFDRLNDLGIDRKAAKSIASQLSNMGLSCSGEIYEDDRSKAGEGDKVDINNSLPEEEKIICRSDSGYESNTPSDDEENLLRFYNMFVEDFFYAPEAYEYTFGAFTLAEIEEVDNYIADLFYSRFPNDNVTHEETNNEVDNTSEIDVEKFEEIKKLEDESEENWDDELCGDCVEFMIPTDYGRLGKVVPIGMTMDDFNGECFSGKVPLFNYFKSVDVTSRPEGGIPKMPGKAGKKDRKRLLRENKRLQNELDYSAINDGSKTVVKSQTGEVFILV